MTEVKDDAEWQKEPHPDKEATKAEETDIFEYK